MNINSGEISITQRLERAKVEDFNDAQAEVFADRMIETLNSAALALMISVGHRTKLFDVMARIDPATSEQIARAARLDERYVREWLEAKTDVTAFRDDLTRFLDTWLPRFEAEGRSYVTICIGCTGGRHRSVYLAEQLSEHFRATHRQVLSYHRELE